MNTPFKFKQFMKILASFTDLTKDGELAIKYDAILSWF